MAWLFAATLCLFFSAQAWAMPPAEEKRTEDFLQALSQEKGLVFIRNGSEHKVDRAVSHLRRKLRSAREKLNSAEEFIDKVASSSSVSGKPYYVQAPGSPREEAGPYFRRLLSGLKGEAGPSDAEPSEAAPKP
jgi:hypothetical protein